MCEYKLCFVYWSVYVICCLPSAVSSVFSCREDEIAVQIISNISLALLVSLTCTHTHIPVSWHLSVAKQYVYQSEEHRSCGISSEICTEISWGIHTHKPDFNELIKLSVHLSLYMVLYIGLTVRCVFSTSHHRAHWEEIILKSSETCS